MNEAKANILWSLIVKYKGSRFFYKSTLTDFPIQGVRYEDVHAIHAFSYNNKMAFHISFKDDNEESIILDFSSSSTVHRLELFLEKHLKRITWEVDDE